MNELMIELNELDEQINELKCLKCSKNIMYVIKLNS